MARGRNYLCLQQHGPRRGQKIVKRAVKVLQIVEV